jgi:uncharacterized protein involved in response to NO
MAAPPSQGLPVKQPPLALFAYGFRPFFWAAGAYALVGLIAWLWIYAHGVLPLPNLPAQLWHGHEMLYGVVAAAMAGFLLTAVPSWTGTRGFGGIPLILLTLAWLAGRVAFAAAAVLPLALVGVCELAFLPALAAVLAPPLLRARNRNTPLLLVITALWIADVVFMYALMRRDVALARTALLVAIDVVLLLVTVIGGRIIPAFTASALRGRVPETKIRASPWNDGIAISAMIALIAVDIVAPWQTLAGAIAALAAIAHALRYIGWRTRRTLNEPLVWSLHLAYAWLPAGLAIKAIFLLTGAAWATQWLHALTIGVAASMLLAVMTRAALGHTGRALVAARPIALAYILLSLAAFVRVFAPSLVPRAYGWTVTAAGALWAGAFAIYVITYTPILFRPRIDSRPG